MEWLLTHPEPESCEAPGTQASGGVVEEETPAAGHSVDPSADVRPKSSVKPASISHSTATATPAADHTSRRSSKAQSILDSFRAYKRRKFKPNVLVSCLDRHIEQNNWLYDVISQILNSFFFSGSELTSRHGFRGVGCTGGIAHHQQQSGVRLRVVARRSSPRQRRRCIGRWSRAIITSVPGDNQ